MTDNYVEFCYSKDRGHTWSNWKRRTLHTQGKYAGRVRIKQLGHSRQWIFRWRVSSPILAACMGAVSHMNGLDS